MASTIHTNLAALGAVQNFDAVNRGVDHVQNRISTGLKASGARDGAATFGIAQQQRAEASSLEAVTTSLNRAASIADVALAAGSALSDVLKQMREKAVAASDPSISDTSRAIHNADFIALRDQIAGIIANASFDGQNLLAGPAASSVTFLASTNGSTSLDLPVLDLTLPASPGTVASPAAAMYLGSGTALTTAANSADAASRVSASLDYLNSELSRLGAASKKIENQALYFSKLKDSVTAGIGKMVDADLAYESAQLQALQTRQQLSLQAMSLANQAPRAILNLLRDE
ncbi:flagellin [Aquidulcibacter paucihalophilus]|uniref:flagellin n=1 Tax=Aquidulcibacter paucihalophilus TaxID=1978549 RepID=UPI000A18EB8D|nr:flagellin [Aquidulcibacter paucihalophilus]